MMLIPLSSMLRTALSFGATLLLVSAMSSQAPQTPAAAPPNVRLAYSGCVQPSPTEKATYILSTPYACAKLTGPLAQPSLSGHLIELMGIFTPATRSTPATLHIDSITHIGPACSDVCALQPPHKRGLGSESPGKEGGTPGAAPNPPPPPPPQ